MRRDEQGDWRKSDVAPSRQEAPDRASHGERIVT